MFQLGDYHTAINTWPSRVVDTYGEDNLRSFPIESGNVAVIGPSYGKELVDLRCIFPEQVGIYGIEIDESLAAHADAQRVPNTTVMIGDGYQLNRHPYIKSQGLKFKAFFFNNNLLPAMRNGLGNGQLDSIVQSLMDVSDDPSYLFVSGNSSYLVVDLHKRELVGQPRLYAGSAADCAFRLLDTLKISYNREEIPLTYGHDPQQIPQFCK